MGRRRGSASSQAVLYTHVTPPGMFLEQLSSGPLSASGNFSASQVLVLTRCLQTGFWRTGRALQLLTPAPGVPPTQRLGSQFA